MLSCLAWPSFSPARSGETCSRARYALSDGARDDSWDSIGWDAEPERQGDPDRDQVLGLARRLAEQRERQRSEDMSQLEELKRALRERAADVARRELEVEERTRRLEQQETAPPRSRCRPAEKPRVDEDRAYADELLARRDADIEERTRAAETRERELAKREAAVLSRQLELEEAEPALSERERLGGELEQAGAGATASR